MNKIEFKDLPDTTTLIDADNLNLLQDNVESDVNNKIGLIKLKSVDITAPEECFAGDLYYNTLTDLIYTATDTDTWGIEVIK